MKYVARNYEFYYSYVVQMLDEWLPGPNIFYAEAVCVGLDEPCEIRGLLTFLPNAGFFRFEFDELSEIHRVLKFLSKRFI